MNYLDDTSETESVRDLERRNEELRNKIIELQMLKKGIRRHQLLDNKRELEQAEVDELKKHKMEHDMELELELDQLRKDHQQQVLESLEREEVL